MTPQQRYAAAAHAVQSGVKTDMETDVNQQSQGATTPKHLRTGLNLVMSDHGSLAKLLIDKGVITEDEYLNAIADGVEREGTAACSAGSSRCCPDMTGAAGLRRLSRRLLKGGLQMTDSAILPPPRSIISLRGCGGECGQPDCRAMIIGCDCATTTHLTVEDAEKLPDGTELAFTCDGCYSVTWFTVRTANGTT